MAAKWRRRLRLWWRRRSQIRYLKNTEVWLFQCGPHTKWRELRDENTRLGVWDGTYQYNPRLHNMLRGRHGDDS